MRYGNFEKLKEQINTDIENVNKVEKFEDNLNKLENNNYGEEDENFKLLITSFSFIFNMYGNKNQYEKSHFKAMQYAFWQTIIEVGRRYAKFTISADFLQYSLEEKPEDLHIIDGIIADEIKGKKQFVAKGQDASISFNNKDLYLVLIWL